ncbi:AT-rich interactive domain-containing protein 6-like isoform X2 [Hordeum vulgare subsp. vulgare]|uniref:ARID domain-containing protein n=2 Tax=Hordeum vulgare subsp. vulgare TaxID=112509 RepID=A0A8I6WS25_HORVV|nr:AT-rich interactive domain-containing protein 6-like isoform X2 [Hordeum vulgare subsp. vulgare]
MRNGEPASGDGQTEAADTVDSVKDSANPESAEADMEVEEQGKDDAMVDADADADAVGSTKDSAVPEEGGAEEVGGEHKGDALVDAAASTVASLAYLGKVEAQGVEEEVEERVGDALVDVSVAHQVKSEAQGNEGAETECEAQGNEVVETKGEAQGNEGAEMKDDTQGNEAAEMDVDKAGNGDEHTEVRVDGDKGSLLKEESDNGGDNKKDANGEDELGSALAGEDENHHLSDKVSNNSFMFDYTRGGDDSGTEEEQAEFIKELDRFYTMKLMEFKPPKFYGEGLNCLKLWRQVTGLGGYDQVTSCKLWRQVGESFKPPKTCTTVSWTFRNFYEKALLEYEKHKIETGEFQVAASTLTERIASDSQVGGSHASGSGRARRESATRAMQGWHSQRLLGNGEIADPVIKDKAAMPVLKKDKNPKSSGPAKRKRTPTLEDEKAMPYKSEKLQNDSTVIDMGPPADWVKINVRRTKDCYEVYALVPGLLREEVHVQSDPAGRLIVTGEPEQLDNPWGVTPFKKVISLPSRIDPHQTSAVVTLHGQLFVRAPFEQSKS